MTSHGTQNTPQEPLRDREERNERVESDLNTDEEAAQTTNPSTDTTTNPSIKNT